MATRGGWASSSGTPRLRTCCLAPPTTTRSGVWDGASSPHPWLQTLPVSSSGAPLGRVPSWCGPPVSNQGASEAHLPALPVRGAAAVRLLQRRWQQAGGRLQGQKGPGPGPPERKDPPGVPLSLFPVCGPLVLTLVVMIQVSRSKTHRANRVLYVSDLKMLLSTGSSRWNQRQVVLWDPVGTGTRSQP